MADSADRAQVNPGGTPAGYEKLLEQLKAPGDNPPQFSTMHRPGIAKVTGNRIVLDGTTAEEFTRHHKQTLDLAVAATNTQHAEHRRREQAANQAAHDDARRHKDHVDRALASLSFDVPTTPPVAGLDP